VELVSTPFLNTSSLISTNINTNSHQVAGQLRDDISSHTLLFDHYVFLHRNYYYNNNNLITETGFLLLANKTNRSIIPSSLTCFHASSYETFQATQKQQQQS
jgi:hypothetical protein